MTPQPPRGPSLRHKIEKQLACNPHDAVFLTREFAIVGTATRVFFLKAAQRLAIANAVRQSRWFVALALTSIRPSRLLTLYSIVRPCPS